MSTVAEIEAAIERLPTVQVDELASWLEEYQRMIHASAQVFTMYDEEEKLSQEPRLMGRLQNIPST